MASITHRLEQHQAELERGDHAPPDDCPDCGGEGYIDGLVVGAGPSVEERCGRCGGRGVVQR
jgi:DnaJ-class molecular chaperone